MMGLRFAGSSFVWTSCWSSREGERERECVCVYFLFFVSLLFCTVFSLDNEKNIHVIMELASYRPLCPVRCLWGIWVSQDFWTSSETGTMACTWHAPEHNGFHTMWACGFALAACRFCTMGAQWACWFWIMVRSGRPKKSWPFLTL